jgi:hypothetical protein
MPNATMKEQQNLLTHKESAISQKARALVYRLSLAIALTGIGYDMTLQEYVREQQANGKIHLEGVLQ